MIKTLTLGHPVHRAIITNSKTLIIQLQLSILSRFPFFKTNCHLDHQSLCVFILQVLPIPLPSNDSQNINYRKKENSRDSKTARPLESHSASIPFPYHSLDFPSFVRVMVPFFRTTNSQTKPNYCVALYVAQPAKTHQPDTYNKYTTWSEAHIVCRMAMNWVCVTFFSPPFNAMEYNTNSVIHSIHSFIVNRSFFDSSFFQSTIVEQRTNDSQSLLLLMARSFFIHLPRQGIKFRRMEFLRSYSLFFSPM